ncbi:MAG: cell division protein FtsL [Actinomycetota bacterium]|nr:cell division protein FtsL [Actinomycetota bacterium]
MTAVASPLRRDARPLERRPGPADRLTVVDKGRAGGAADTVRRRRLLACAVTAVVVACVLGLVVSHVALAQGQFELEKLQAKAAEEQARYERLRLQVAQLESPSRVVAAAQSRLGMVPPPGVTYLSPTGTASGQPTTSSGGKKDESATDDWSSVKRQLATR